MIEVACFFSRRCAAGFSEFAIYGYEINDRPASAQLDQAKVVLASLHHTSERTAVEAEHAVEIDNAQYKMVDFANTDHRVREAGG